METERGERGERENQDDGKINLVPPGIVGDEI